MRQQRASCVSVHGEEGVLASRVERGRHPVGSVEEAGQSSRASPLGIVSQPSSLRVWLPCEWRRRRGSWIVLVVLVGVGAGAVLGIASGARRTDSAYGRFVAQSSPADLMVASGYVGLGPTTDLGRVAKLPGVRSTSNATFLPAIGRTSSGYRFLPFEAATGAATDGQFGNSVDRWKILSGRRAVSASAR